MRRVPLLSGSSLVLVDAPDDAVVLAPPEPDEEPLADVAAAVRDALRFPLAGEPLEELVPRGGRATIVVEPPALPIPGAQDDPRRAALVAASDELARAGIPTERQTILVACGLARRPGRRDLEPLVVPEFARRFHGELVVHDAADPDLVDVGAHEGVPLRVARALVETDLAVTVTAAQSVLHGGPGALLGAGGADALRAAGAESLVETHGAPGWELATELERALRQRVRLASASLALAQPRLTGALLGYPYEDGAFERVARSPAARMFRLLPAPVRMRILRSFPLELPVSAVFGGPPSVSHAEALLRSVGAASATLARPLDALIVGVPRATPSLPRERPNPLQAAYLALGHALRLHRDGFPVRSGGAVVIVHDLRRRFAHPTQAPYRAWFRGAAEHDVLRDERAVAAYRAGDTVHPLLPFVERDALQPALDRVGNVFVAGCRDAVAARRLELVPTHDVGAALEMVRGWSANAPRIGFLLSPPYFPVAVGGG